MVWCCDPLDVLHPEEGTNSAKHEGGEVGPRRAQTHIVANQPVVSAQQDISSRDDLVSGKELHNDRIRITDVHSI